MVGRVEQYVRKQQLLSPDGLHLVALSGGADSVALLLVLKQLGYRIEAVHCNFHLRGEESDRDEDFVKTLCKQHDISLHLIHFDTEEYASVHQVSIEMAARELRYRYFEQLRQDIGAETICVAHHRDDAVETLLMNLMRGAGIHGLTGIHPKNGTVVRPLLGVCRQDIEDYLRQQDQSYVTDSTNLQPDVLRNKIRLQLLPLFESIYPGSIDNIARSAHYLSEAEKVYNSSFSTQDCPQCALIIPHSSVFSAPSPLSLLYERLTPLGFNRTQVEQILSCLQGESGREFTSPTHILVIDRDRLVVEPISEPMKPFIIPEPGLYRLDETATLRVEHVGTDIGISRDPQIATLDASQVRFPLTIRTTQEGDRFQPFGMRGKKLVSDFLTDQKLNILEKRRQLVVTDATGTILWLVGFRIAESFRITDATTACLRLTKA
ncbi:MAG: tRNA lysidine(34) synthetase TilS [Prevotella sp.]|nr:tRNA lysidine(34) synthetase TilS [Prevotella sp.]